MYLHARSVQEAASLSPRTNGVNGDSGDDSSEGSLEHNMHEGHFGLTTEEEIEQAISECKDAILASVQSSDERHRLVRRLVELRLRRLELREAAAPLPEGVRLVRAHTLQPQRVSRRRAYCHVCARLIVALIHRWYNCQGCNLNVHAGCLENIRRNCAVEKVREEPQYDLRICPERGLGAQNFRCAECGRRIMLEPEFDAEHPPFGEDMILTARLCDYSGLMYCTFCHWNDRAIIPARVIHNWEFDKYPVSCGNLQYLELMCNKPVLDLERSNPRLFSFLEELRHIKKLREEMLLMKQYFLSCRAALQSRILLAFGDRQYFVESSHMYSMRDLCEVPTGQLLEFLLGVHAKFAKHIREDCEACRGKGHICEVCASDEVLFAFDAQVMPCPRCRRVMHQHCYVRRDGQCPRCTRLEARQRASSDPDLNQPADPAGPAQSDRPAEAACENPDNNVA